MGLLLSNLFAHPDWWKYASIPVVAALVGWGTNWVAIRLTFYPLEFVGIRPFLGWQGIIPSKAGRMAGIFVDSTMSRLGTVDEVFEEMDPDKIAGHVLTSLLPRMEEITDEVMLETHPILWENLPRAMKDAYYRRVEEALPELVHNLMKDVGRQVESLLDFKHMITSRLEEDKQLLNRLFLECGEREFAFLIRSGLYYGFLFGLVQLAVWVIYPAWWVLPLFGLMVGWATNWIAINQIFRPLNPIKIGPWVLQGMFLKRQKEVAAVWCRITTREILTIRALIEAMLHGPKAHRSRNLVRKHIKPVVDEAVGATRGLTQIAVGLGGFAEIKETVADKALEVSGDPFEDHIFNEDRSHVIERILRQRMEALPPEQFQDLLRPCFQEDELKLILTGAALGLAAGFAQLIFVFGGF